MAPLLMSLRPLPPRWAAHMPPVMICTRPSWTPPSWPLPKRAAAPRSLILSRLPRQDWIAAALDKPGAPFCIRVATALLCSQI
eukprot:2246822-Pyramimonas_sp.AAC.1